MKKRALKKKKADQRGQMLLLLGVVGMAVLGYFVFQANENVVARSSSTLCRQDGVISKETAIVIDATDSFSQSQAILVKKEIQAMLKNSLVDERITLYVLGENIRTDIDQLSVCNPGDGSEKSELTSNKRRLREKWETLFYERVVEAVDELVGERHAVQSPILEMMKLVSVKTMYDSPAREKRIVLVSDMLQHTEAYSHYRQRPDYQSFSETAYSVRQKPHLLGVDVSILYLLRPRNLPLQNRGHIGFWESLVTENGGLITRVKTIN